MNRDTITDTLSWCNIWRLKDPWWNKTSQGRHGIISWNLALICEVDHGIIDKSKSTPHRSKRFEIAEQRYGEEEEGSFAQLLQLTTRRWMDAMMNCNYLRKIPKERRFNESVESKKFIWFVEMIITPFLFSTDWNSTNSGAQYYPNHSSNTSGTRGEKFGKELLW